MWLLQNKFPKRTGWRGQLEPGLGWPVMEQYKPSPSPTKPTPAQTLFDTARSPSGLLLELQQSPGAPTRAPWFALDRSRAVSATVPPLPKRSGAEDNVG